MKFKYIFLFFLINGSFSEECPILIKKKIEGYLGKVTMISEKTKKLALHCDYEHSGNPFSM